MSTVSYLYYLYVSCSGSITSVREERELICLLSFTCNYVVSVRRCYLFLLVLGTDCVILLWHSLGFPYNYLGIYSLLLAEKTDGLEVPHRLCSED